MSCPTFDVAVVGAGPAGSATATDLGRRGFSVALIDPGGGGFKIGETVPPEIEAPLRKLGAWEPFLADGHRPSLAAFSAWGGPELDARDAFSDPGGAGWRLDRRAFDDRLAERAEAAGAVRMRRHVVGVEAAPGEAVRLATTDGPLACEFVVDATGRGAGVARRLGARAERVDRLVAAYATFPRTAQGAFNLVEAEAAGWWYAANLPDDRAVVALFSDSDLLRASGRHRVAAWSETLAQTSQAALYASTVPDVLRVSSAASHLLQPVVGSRWTAVGDAAMAWDPLTSGGVVQALRSGLAAAEGIEARFVGNPVPLAGFARGLGRLFAVYLQARAACYTTERRWTVLTFWTRRSST